MLYPKTQWQIFWHIYTVQHFRFQEVLQPLQLQLTLGTLMHLGTCLQTCLHTSFFVFSTNRPIGTKGWFLGYLNANLANSFEVR